MARARGATLIELRGLYERRLCEFRRVAAAIVGGREAAEDVVQEAFVRAVRARDSFAGDGPLDAWVWRIVVNAARAAARSPLVEASVNGGFRSEAPSAVVQLTPLIAALPERQRHAVFLRYYADLDYRSIAAVLGIEVGTVSATLSAAHQAVRRALKEVVPHD